MLFLTYQNQTETEKKEKENDRNQEKGENKLNNQRSYTNCQASSDHLTTPRLPQKERKIKQNKLNSSSEGVEKQKRYTKILSIRTFI